MHTAWVQNQSGLVTKHKPPTYLRRLQQACAEFEDALLKLPNITELWAKFSGDDVNGYLWRDAYFSGPFPVTFAVPCEDRPKEVAPLAFLLRALGKRNHFSSSLVSINLCLGDELRWTLSDLCRAWSKEDSFWQIQPPLMVDQANGLMGDAFIHLTDLRLSYTDSFNGRALKKILSKAKQLVSLEIIYFYSCSRQDRGGTNILEFLNLRTPGSTLTEQELARFRFKTRSPPFVRSGFISTVNSLSPKQCVLLEEGG